MTTHESNPLAPQLEYFENMIDVAYDFAEAHVQAGKPIVGIMCEYTPRELMLAAGALPVCLCGGSYETIADAEAYLPANLCPLIKSTFGYHISKQNPFLEWASLVVAETTCDGKKKMYEVMAETRDMHILELPQKVNDPDAFNHWVSEVRKLQKVLEEKYDVSITDAKLNDAIRLMNRERTLRKKLAGLMKRNTPPITGLQLLELKNIISCIPSDFEAYEAILNTAEKIPDAPEKNAKVRVLLTGVPTPHGAERVLALIESLDALVVAQENCSGLKPLMSNIPEDAADPIIAIADHYFHLPCSVMTPNTARLDLIRQLAEEYRVEMVVDLAWQACLTYEVESHATKKFVEDTLGLPYLKVVTDYSPHDTERLRVRIEALIEIAKGQR